MANGRDASPKGDGSQSGFAFTRLEERKLPGVLFEQHDKYRCFLNKFKHENFVRIVTLLKEHSSSERSEESRQDLNCPLLNRI